MMRPTFKVIINIKLIRRGLFRLKPIVSSSTLGDVNQLLRTTQLRDSIAW